MAIKFLCVCSGISAPTMAWTYNLGWEAIAYAEIDPAACAVLSERYGAGRPRFMPDPAEAKDQKEARRRAAAIKALDRVPEWGTKVRNEGDFTRLRDEPWIVDADVLTGGTPCQDFSLAGLRAGITGDRGNLSLEFIRLANAIDDLRCAAGRPPAAVLWENVPGVFSTKDNAFGAFLGGLVGSASPLHPPRGRSWTDAGVVAGPRRVAAWRVEDAQHFGLAQRRRRVFVLALGYPGAWRVADALLPIIDSMRGDPAPRRETAAEASARAGARSPDPGRELDGPDGRGAGEAGGGGGVPARTRGMGRRPVRAAYGGNRTSGAVDVATARNAHSGPHGRLDFETETFVVEPIAFDTTQLTHPENRSNPKPGDPAPTLAGRGHAPAIAFNARQDPISSEDLSPPLDSHAETVAVTYAPERAGPLLAGTEGAGPRSTEVESGNLVAVGFSCKDSGQDASEDVAPTLRAMSHDQSHPNAGGQIAVAIQLAHTQQNGSGLSEDVAHSLDTGKTVQAVAFSMRGRDGENMIEPEPGDVAPALRTGDGGSSKPFVAIAFQERGRSEGRTLEVGGDKAYALTAPAGGSRAQEKLVAVAVNVEHGLAPHGSMELKEVADEVTASEGKGHTAVVDAEAFAFKPSHFTRGKDGAPAETSPSLTADADKGDQDPLVYVSEVARTLTSASDSPAAHGKVNGTDRAELVGFHSAVRRLTPRECERLQGFPDDHTLIEWGDARRSPEDLEETILYLRMAGYGENEARALAMTPDGPRYRLLGNSQAVDVILDLGYRIQWVLEG